MNIMFDKFVQNFKEKLNDYIKIINTKSNYGKYLNYVNYVYHS